MVTQVMLTRTVFILIQLAIVCVAGAVLKNATMLLWQLKNDRSATRRSSPRQETLGLIGSAITMLTAVIFSAIAIIMAVYGTSPQQMFSQASEHNTMLILVGTGLQSIIALVSRDFLIDGLRCLHFPSRPPNRNQEEAPTP
jgi:hypothetical protein